MSNEQSSPRPSSVDEELLSTIRELTDALNRQQMAELSKPPTTPSGEIDQVDLQYGHSAARWNEQMAQLSIDKSMAFMERQQDRWTLLFKMLRDTTDA